MKTTDATPELPELPEPEVRCGEYAGPAGEGASENYYTADQIRERDTMWMAKLNAALSASQQATEPKKEIERGELLKLANEAFGQTVDCDLAGNPITDYDVLLWGAFGPAVTRLVNLAVQRYAATPAARVPDNWLPIETAPKDGTDILLAAVGQTYAGKPVAERVTIGHWATEEECREIIGDCGGVCCCPEYEYHEPWWFSWDGGFTDENPPTHWMPLPAAPNQDREES